MKRISILLLVSVLITYCNGQDKNKSKSKTDNKEHSVITTPNASVTVNRKYDSKGNLIRFDSTYSYHYSSKGLDSSKVSMNQYFKDFKSHFPMDWRNEFNDIFFDDSLAKYDFLNPDYFSRRFELNMERMRRHFQNMDSTKTRFLKDNPKTK